VAGEEPQVEQGLGVLLCLRASLHYEAACLHFPALGVSRFGKVRVVSLRCTALSPRNDNTEKGTGPVGMSTSGRARGPAAPVLAFPG
jgi:hypothetical protein